MPRSVGVLSVLVIFFISRAQSYFITVDAHAEECFFDKVKTGTKMGLMFEVAEGGFLDIDVRIEGKLVDSENWAHGPPLCFTFFDFINKIYRSRRKDCSFGRTRE